MLAKATLLTNPNQTQSADMTVATSLESESPATTTLSSTSSTTQAQTAPTTTTAATTIKSQDATNLNQVAPTIIQLNNNLTKPLGMTVDVPYSESSSTANKIQGDLLNNAAIIAPPSSVTSDSITETTLKQTAANFNTTNENGSTSAIRNPEAATPGASIGSTILPSIPPSSTTTGKTIDLTNNPVMKDAKLENESSLMTKPQVATPSSNRVKSRSSSNDSTNTATNISTASANADPTTTAADPSKANTPKPAPKRSRKKKTDSPNQADNQASSGTSNFPIKLTNSQPHHPTLSGASTGTSPSLINTPTVNNSLVPNLISSAAQDPSAKELTPSKIKSRSSSKDSASTAITSAISATSAKKTPAKRPRKKKTDPPNTSSEGVSNTQTLSATSAGANIANTVPLMINTSMANNKMVQNSNQSEAQETSSRNYSPNKRKSRSSSKESTTTAASATAAANPIQTPAKRVRKKKTDPPNQQNERNAAGTSASSKLSNAQATPAAPVTVPIGTSPLMINTPLANTRFLQNLNSNESQDMGTRYYSPMISPYANFEHLNASSLTRPSLSRLFTSSSANGSNSNSNQINSADDPVKAFDELRENTWSHLHRCVLEQAQQFDVPLLIGTLYTLRSENEKLMNKVRDLTMKRDQLIAMNARLDLPGPALAQHLNSTSPNFSSVVSGLANSPKSLPNSSPSSVIGKPPLITPIGSYNHIPQPSSLGPPSYLERSSPFGCQPPHSGISNIKTSSISTPSPPIGALMAHSTSNRAGLITVNPPSMPNVFPPMNPLAQLGSNPQGSSNYRQ